MAAKPRPSNYVAVVVALHDYSSSEATCLSFRKGELIYVHSKDSSGWWDGTTRNHRGWFPSNYVEAANVDPPASPRTVVDLANSGNSRPASTNSTNSADTGGGKVKSATQRKLDELQDMLELMLTEVGKSDEDNGKEAPSPAMASTLPVDAKRASIQIRPRSSSINAVANAMSGDAAQSPVVNEEKTTRRSTLIFMDARQNPSSASMSATQPSSRDMGKKRPLSWKLGPSLIPTASKITWDVLINNVLHAISDLNRAADEDKRGLFLEQTNIILRSIRDMMVSSGTITNTSTALTSSATLRSHHHGIMLSLSKLVITAKIASGLWPPPDSVSSMKYEASQVLLGVRHFVSTGQELNLELREPSSETSFEFELLGSDLSSGEFVSRLDDGADKVVTSVARLVAVITMERRASGVLVEHARATVTAVGQLLSLVEDIRTEDLASVNENLAQLIGEFRKAKESAYDIINDLITFTRTTMDSFAPPKALSKLLDCTSAVLKTVDDVVMSTKLLIDSHDFTEQQSLLTEAERLQSSSSKRESDLIMLQRRAMSLTFLPSTNAAPVIDRRPSYMPPPDSAGTDSSNPNGGELQTSPKRLSFGKTQSNPNIMSPILNHRRPSAANVIDDLTRSIRRPSSPNGPLVQSEESYLKSPGPQSAPQIRVPGNRSSFGVEQKRQSDTSRPADSIWYDDFGAPSVEAAPAKRNDKLAKFFGERPKEDSFKSDRRLWFLDTDYTPDSISFSKEGVVNGGTFAALVERLTLHDQPSDPVFSSSFLLMFRCFTTPAEFVDRMIARYLINPPPNINSDDMKIWQEKKQTPIRLRVYNTWKMWLENYWIEEDDSPVLEQMLHFARGPITDNQPNLSQRLIQIIQSKYSALQTGQKGSTTSISPRKVNNDEPPSAIIPRISYKKLSLIDIDPLEIARQITLLQSRIFNSIHPSELINLEWSRKGGKALNVRAMTDMSNKITGWVVDTILSEADPKKRAIVLKHFVKIGDRAIVLKNFDLAMAVISALNSSSISRLAKTWILLTNKTNDTLSNLHNISDNSRNYTNYRSELRNLSPPCIPFLGLYLTDLTFTVDGNPDVRNEKLINFDKFVKMYKIIVDIQRFQYPYALTEVTELADWIFTGIKASSQKNAHDLYDLSLILEPRGSKEPDEAVTFRELEDKLKMLEDADIDGIPRGKLVSAEKFKKSVDGGFGFCSVVFGWDCHDVVYNPSDVSASDEKGGYKDINAKFDLSTLRFIPWENRIPHFLVDFYDPRTDLPLPQCPRSLLKRMVKEAADLGYRANIGIEYEFFNFAETPASLAEKDGVKLEKLTPGMFGYSMTRPIVKQEYFYDILNACNEFKVPLEGFHTETGPGVYEVAINYNEPITLADSAHLFKMVTKSVGIKHGITPSFMAKPHNDLPGCSGHIHVSLSPLDGSGNSFAPSNEGGDQLKPGTVVPALSKLAESFLAGVLKGLPSTMACYAPNINSYKRLVENFWAPVTVSYGVENRCAAIRLITPPTCPPSATRLEIRVPGADSNPYIAIASILACGLEGIRSNLPLTLRPLEEHVEGVDPKPVRLARDLRDAVEALSEKGSFARKVLGDAFVDHYAGTRKHEWKVWETAVTNWELKRYLEVA
ncbi:hypothetical protein HDU67_000842 [Dinochytrium kinnereticum]|nr:hypothetical protein HDU67_000842 [Dinochytrium kinnereticum]